VTRGPAQPAGAGGATVASDWPLRSSDRATKRDFMDELRASGVQTGGPPPLAHADRQRFANQLDRLLVQARGGQERQ
jgi:hypothetical protein